MSKRLVRAAVICLLASVFYLTARHRRDFVDFEVYQTAGQRALAAEPLYRADDGHYQFKYLPAFALAMTPFAGLDPEVAKPIWFAISAALLVGFITRTIRTLPDRRLSHAALGWIAAALVGKFAVMELVNGQTNILLGWLIAMALLGVGAGRRSDAVAGVLVGLAIFVKPYAVLFLPWLIVMRGAAAPVSAAAVLAAGLVLPAARYGWTANLDLLAGWWHTVSATTPENIVFGENVSIASMWAKWMGAGPTATAAAAITGLIVLNLTAIVCAWRRRTTAPDYLETGLLLWLVPLLSPQGWAYVLLLGAPALVAVADRWRELPPGWRAVAAVAVAIPCFSIYDLLGRTLYLHVLDSAAETVAALAVVGVIADVRRRGLA